MSRDPRRRFTRAEREALFLEAGGQCQSCGADLLTSDYQADHVIAWANEGATDVLNGAALCRSCNGKKGSK